jgi:hypothetical protein
VERLPLHRVDEAAAAPLVRARAPPRPRADAGTAELGGYRCEQSRTAAGVATSSPVAGSARGSRARRCRRRGLRCRGLLCRAPSRKQGARSVASGASSAERRFGGASAPATGVGARGKERPGREGKGRETLVGPIEG